MDKAIGKRPSLTLTASNDNLSFSVTPFFSCLPHHNVVASSTACEEEPQSPPRTSVMLPFAAPVQALVHDAPYLHGTAAQGEVRGHSGAAVRHTSVNTLFAAMTLYYLQTSGLPKAHLRQ